MSEPQFIKDIENAGHAVLNYLKTNPITKTLENGAKSAEAELKAIAPADLEKAVETIGVAVLGSLGSGEEVAIAAGIAAAPAAFKAVEKDVTAKTTTTLVSSIVTQLQAQQATAPQPSPSPEVPPISA